MVPVRSRHAKGGLQSLLGGLQIGTHKEKEAPQSSQHMKEWD
jgi:hypothetical protein